MDQRLPNCTDLDYGQIWRLYQVIYTARGVTEEELRRTHLKWKRLAAWANGGFK